MTDHSEDQFIIDASDLRKYRTEIPNMADDDLDPYQYRLYAHYKRVGVCNESVATTAKACKMSPGKVCSTRDSLVDEGWINVYGEEGVQGYVVVLRDRWAENFARYANHSCDEWNRSPDESDRSPHESKNKPIKKEQKKDSASAPKSRPRDAIFDAVAQGSFNIRVGTTTTGSGGRIGKIVSWLKALKPPQTEDDIRRFYEWYGKEYPKISAPRDLAKFREHYESFLDRRVVVSTVPTMRKPAGLDDYPELTPEQREHNANELERLRREQRAREAATDESSHAAAR